ncbi:hypothetical protein [Haloarchaeobius amylolyticus]|uniref:hypothetical protein n=1 Tax=Haloarchaeobius amylolyticus TaxID=1198296 RepID=UPI00227013A3|nr:hypothetical protein [Haloarchaeobius amylolyticus]
MSLSAVLLYAVLDDLPALHTRVALSLLPVALLGTVVRVAQSSPASERLGLGLAVIAVALLLVTVCDGLRRTWSVSPDPYDTLS